MRAASFTPAILPVVLVLALGPAPASDSASIYKTLADMNDHTILYVGIKEAGLGAELSGRTEGTDPVEGSPPQNEQYTLFAPTDVAFKKLDEATVKQLATDKVAVKKLIRAHLARGKKTADDLKALNGKDLPMIRGGARRVEDVKDGLRIGGALIVTANIQCSNGVIHVIDTVLPVAKE